MPDFHWASRDVDPPGRWDLRLIGWSMCGRDPGVSRTAACPVLFDHRSASCPADWRGLLCPALVAAIGVDDTEERAAMLSCGFGDALPMAVSLVELEARLLRLARAALAMPRRLGAGPVELDLMHRDGRVAGSWLGLHPREFALLWRLAETPGERVSRAQLLSEVWRLDHVPQTNSLEVHVSRLRAKLAISKADWLVRTDPRGGYRLASEGDAAADRAPA